MHNFHLVKDKLGILGINKNYHSDQLLSEIGGHCGLYLGLSIASLVRTGIL